MKRDEEDILDRSLTTKRWILGKENAIPHEITSIIP
jgi:hypothetical protein